MRRTRGKAAALSTVVWQQKSSLLLSSLSQSSIAGDKKKLSEEKPPFMWLPRRPAAALLVCAFLFILMIFHGDSASLLDEYTAEEMTEEPSQSLSQRRVVFYPRNTSSSEHPSKFIVAVHIRVEEFKRRVDWRHTLGNLQKAHNFSLIFALGRPRNQSMYRMLEKEQKMHGDLLLGDFNDSYKNMTHKHLMLLRYFHQNCKDVPFLVKVDDDVAINVKMLAEMVSWIKKETSWFSWLGVDYTNGAKIWCHVWKTPPVRRTAGGKWSIPRSRWAEERWPDYCAGMSYVTSQEAAGRLLDATREETWLWVDDIFVTGVLAKRADVQLVAINRYYGTDEEIRGPFENGWKIFQLTHRNQTRTSFEIANN